MGPSSLDPRRFELTRGYANSRRFELTRGCGSKLPRFSVPRTRHVGAPARACPTASPSPPPAPSAPPDTPAVSGERREGGSTRERKEETRARGRTRPREARDGRGGGKGQGRREGGAAQSSPRQTLATAVCLPSTAAPSSRRSFAFPPHTYPALHYPTVIRSS